MGNSGPITTSCVARHFTLVQLKVKGHHNDALPKVCLLCIYQAFLISSQRSEGLGTRLDMTPDPLIKAWMASLIGCTVWRLTLAGLVRDSSNVKYAKDRTSWS